MSKASEWVTRLNAIEDERPADLVLCGKLDDLKYRLALSIDDCGDLHIVKVIETTPAKIDGSVSIDATLIPEIIKWAKANFCDDVDLPPG